MSSISGNKLSTATIEKWTSNQFSDFVKKGQSDKGFTIKGRHFQYKVTVDKAGESTVTVAKGKFYTSPEMRERAEERAIKLSIALNRYDRRSAYADKIQESLSSQSTSVLAKKLDKVEHREIALYGKGVRDLLSEGLGGAGLNSRQVKIDHYNAALGVNHLSNCQDLQKLLKDLQGRKVSGQMHQTLVVEQGRCSLPSRQRVVAWAQYLEKNADRLDIMGKCHEKFMKDTSGTGKELAMYLMKNHPVKGLIKGMENEWREAGNNETLKLKVLMKSPAFKEVLDAAREGKMPEHPSGAFNLFFMSAFFRQTSKMGLEFFAAQGVPVVFDVEGMDSKLMTTGKLEAKPWKTLDSRDGFHEPITYSEMRHVNRLKNNLSKLHEKHDNIPNPNPLWKPVGVVVERLGGERRYLTLPEKSPI